MKSRASNFRLGKLSSEKRALLALRLLKSQKGAVKNRQETISRCTRADGLSMFPPSFAQERLWFLDQLEPGSVAYNIPGAIRIKGALQVEVLERAVKEIVRRHEALRTRFEKRDGVPVQLIEAEGALKLETVNLEGMNEEEQRRRIEKLAKEEGGRPFDLARGPLLRMKLARLGGLEHVLFFTMHHIVSDGWSTGVLVREFGQLYEAYSQGRPSPLKELPIQYVDYAVWQRGWLQGEVLEKQLGYWKERLAGAPILELPTDRVRPAVQSYNGAGERLVLSKELLDGLNKLSRRQGATLFMVLSAAFKVLLHRYSGQEDIVVGTPIANRNRGETEGLIGFFVNTLALRTDMSGDPTFLELLEREREVALGAYGHQDVPFERLVAELQVERDLSRSPLFQVMLNMLNLGDQKLSLPGLEVEQMESYLIQSKFDLTLYVVEQEKELKLEIVYNKDLFNKERIVEMLEQLELVLGQVVSLPERRINDFSLTTKWMTERMLPQLAVKLKSQWDVAVHQLFEQQAKKFPKAVAICEEQTCWSYEELDHKSNHLANYLRAQGVGAGDRVAVYGNRSANLVLALLGILKAGGSFMILDPSYPGSRLKEYVQLAKPRGYLYLEGAGEIGSELKKCMASFRKCFDLELPLDWSRSQNPCQTYSLDSPNLEIEPDQEAYVAFTSGSAGRPKGIVGTHLPLAHFVKWQGQEFGLSREDKFSLLSGLSHDPLLRDIFTPLSLGAQLCIPRESYLESENLAAWVKKQKISVMHLTPALGQVLCLNAERSHQPLKLQSLRYAFFGGDVLTEDVVKGFSDIAPLVQCVNFYGTTETPQAMGYYRVGNYSRWQANRLRRIPIGTGIEGVNLVIINKSKQLTGIGEIGEIWVRSPYLSGGYLGDLALTKERFQRNWFGNCKEDRMYRTGDLGRYLPDGNIEFWGRKDYQVKIRGFRIELGEIEAALGQHCGVQQTVVVVQEDKLGEKQLVGYVVLKNGSSATDDELKEYLKERLPEYMVPAFIVMLEKLPLTPNGKVDRKALPSPNLSKTVGMSGMPRIPTEALMATIWQQVLKIDQIGIHDNFFKLGGHSLLAARVISRVWEMFGVELPLRNLFEAPTVAQLSEKVEDARRKDLEPVPKIARIEKRDSLPLSYTQERLWILDQMEPGNVAYNMPGALWIKGVLDIKALESAIREIIARHEILRTTFETTAEGQPVQMIHEHEWRSLPIVDLAGLPDRERELTARQLIEEESGRPFDLAKGPLIYVKLVRLGESEQVLFYTMHHIISDGWSMGVLAKEFGRLYEAFSNGQPSPLPAMPIQYADYAVWQRGWLQGKSLKKQLEYWREQLKAMPWALELPTDRPRPAVPSHLGSAMTMVLSKELSLGLKKLSQQHGVTLFMTLLAGWKVLLYRYTGQEDVVVGTPIVNRNRREIEELIGFFMNTLVIRTDLSGNPTFLELLDRERKVALDAYEHQDIPFEQLVQELQPERDLSRNPLFQVFFNLINLGEETLEMRGLQLSTQRSETVSTKFDLTLYVNDVGEQLRLELVYSTDLFKKWRMEEFLDQYHLLLMQSIEAPETRITDFTLVSERIKKSLPQLGAKVESRWKGGVHQFFSREARRCPEAVAVMGQTECWSYAELDKCANQLASCLRTRGLKPGNRVAIYGNKSAGLILALIGVLKASGSFVILDRSYPENRLKEYVRVVQPRACILLDDTGARQPAFDRYLTELADCFKLVLPATRQDMMQVLGAYSSGDLQLATNPEQECYLAFTSGTTGVPKGIIGTHSPLAHFIAWHAEQFGLMKGDRFSLLSGLSHDPLLRDIFAPLSVGARICIPDETSLEHGDLGMWMKEAQVSVAHLTPALGRFIHASVKDAKEPFTLDSLRYAFFGGDLLTRGDIQRLQEIAPSVQCVNFYGTTETPQAMSYYRIPGGEREFTKDLERVPIGAGIEGVDVILLNRSAQLAGIGELGEIWVRTPYLSSGYLNDPTLTQERFRRNWFGNGEEDRMYKTGDWGRYLPDGNIEYWGRMDQQVKVRGFRIELGEIESVLRQHPGVNDAAVIAWEDKAGDKQLAGYVVGKEMAGPVDQELRRHVREKLPEYMVPSVFVMLERMPLTANGKVDRKALPAPERRQGEGAFIAPRTPSEELMAGIYQAVLKVEQVGVHDNFFELGGHSLLATRLVSRIRGVFGVDLPLRSLFEAPTVDGLSEKVEEIRRSGKELMVPPLRKMERKGDLPLSYAQERLWLLYLIYPEFPFNMRLVFRIEGNLNLELLRESFYSVFKRHEMLRTSFQVVDGLPRQVIVPDPALKIPLVALSNVPSAEKEATRLIEEDMRQPFDLAECPLFRVKVFRLGHDHHIFMLVMHHILADGWSMRVLAREFVELYEAFSKSRPSPLPELPIQYGDFAMWQRNWLQGKMLASQLEYWKGKLGGDLPVLELPTNRPRPAVPSRRGAIERFTIDKKILDELERLSQQNGVTLFMTLLTAFDTLLYRYTGQEDILVGTHFANRNRTETEGLIGFFINRLLLRSNLSGDPIFEELLQQTREVTLQAYKNGDIPFEQVAAEIKHKSDLNRTSLVQVMIVLENELEKLPTPSDLKVSVIEFEQPIADVDIYLSFVKTPSGLQGSLQYSTDIFDRSRIVQITRHLLTILNSVISNPRQRVSDLEILSRKERRQLLEEWNDTKADYPKDKCIHELFEEQVEQTPEAVAVVYEKEQLTYRELNERSNRLAHYLRKLGVEPEVLVGICMERSLEMIVGLLGILKAGGAYVPLDPQYPKERLAFMLEDARVKVVLTQERFRGRVGGKVKEIVCLDSWTGGGERKDNLGVVVWAKNMAYMIYTSGSTGNPKGAINTHEGIRNRLQWMQDVYRLGVEDRVLQKTPYTFDVSVWEFFWPLMSGSRLVVAQPEGHKDVPYLIQLIERERITTVHFVPSILQVFLEEVSIGRCSELKRVICSGESLSHELVRRFFERLPGQLHNLYGPTEASVDVTYWACPRHMEGKVVPIGKPIANMVTYILDKHLNPVPVGIRGEIYLGGVGLGRGYFGRADLTGEKFVPNPFSKKPGDRLYRTGDLGRYLPDGNIEFVGRVDHQVKVRGYRIELGEIEAVLSGHAMVGQAVVVVWEEEGEKRLVGYVVAQAGAKASVEELRNYLKGKLPEYMVPAFIVMMDSLPLTPSGKIDRRRLPEPEAITNENVDFIAPETPIEKELAAIWKRVLKVERIGIHQNFFDLGGHSLMATQIITQIRDVFRIELPLRTLFTGDFTIAGLARIIVERQLQQIDQTEIAGLLTQLEGLSDDEARKLLSDDLKT